MKQIFGPWRQCGTVAVVSHGSRRWSEMVCGQPDARLWDMVEEQPQRLSPALGAGQAQAGGQPPHREELGLPKGAALLYKDRSS